MMKVFEYSNIGTREINQDSLLSMSIDQETSIHLVADGIGGFSFGEIASKVVCDSYREGMLNGLTIDEATSLASTNLLKERRSLNIQKMGSTAAGVVLQKNKAQIFWSGDSRVYVFRDNIQIFVTKDHSYLNELSKLRSITFEDRQKYGHIITRSLTGNEDDGVESLEMKLEGDEEIFICTDGIYNDCPVDYLVRSIRTGSFDIDKQNEYFGDNHSLIYIAI